MIKIDNLTYTYPDQTQPALRRVSLAVAAGEFVLVAGASGSGKSTLLRSLNGLVPHFSGGLLQGEIEVHGRSPISAGPQQMSRHVGFVAQNPEAQAILDRVEPEIAFGLENSVDFQPAYGRESKAEQARQRQAMQHRVADMMAMLDLTPLRQRPLTTLSGGERQKVALASALVLQPSLLVLDEPTSQLDPDAAGDLLDALVRLNRQHGYTIVLSEHRLERVLPYASRLVYLANGRIRHDGPPREVVAHLDHVPPVVALGRRLGWEPLPLSVSEARQFQQMERLESGNGQPQTTNPQSPHPVLEVQNVSFRYGQKPVLADVSLTVQPGEVVALLGANGVGKSTLLRCVVGLLAPAAGEIRVNGRATHNRRAADICREVAYLPQNPDDLLFADSVAAELRTTLGNHELPQAKATIDNLLARLNLTDVRDSYPRDLSVGQRQRVALGAITVTQPPLILLDEPTRGLDPAAKVALIAIWRSWQAEGKSILLVTHDVELVAQAAPRVVILEAGRVAADGPTADILPHFPTFAPQISRLFPERPWLTVADCLPKNAGKTHTLQPI